MAAGAASPSIVVERFLGHESREGVLREVRASLAQHPRQLAPRFFYDDHGSELFERITSLPEYYPTRCEREILNRHAPTIVGDAEELVELGSGAASKTRALLYAMAAAGNLRRYVPIDVSEAIVLRSAEELTEALPGLAVHAIIGDFGRHLEHLPPGGPRLVAFLGGTIGNLDPGERGQFLAEVRRHLAPGDRLLLGTDLRKDVATMEAAYNDAQGVTAAFNRNALRVVNDLVGSDFRPDAFDHRAFFDPEAGRIEMRLRARGPQRVSADGQPLVDLADGEEIRTEISTKFTRTGLAAELDTAGLGLEAFVTDAGGRFGLSVASPRA